MHIIIIYNIIALHFKKITARIDFSRQRLRPYIFIIVHLCTVTETFADKSQASRIPEPGTTYDVVFLFFSKPMSHE